MEKLNIGDIWWVHFPFSDTSQLKRRPAIIIDNDTIAILTIYVTSQNKANPFSIEIKDWKEAGLLKPSWARIDRIVRIGEYNLDQRVGTLTNKDRLKFMQLTSEVLLHKTHEFSLLAIKNSDGKFLQKYDERWDCWLFPHFRTEEDNKAVADKTASELVQNKVYTQYVTTAKHCKYSVSDQVYKIYNHKLYRLNLDILPEHMTEDEFDINGTKYSWLSIRQMENNSIIMEKNEEIVAFVKCNCK